MSRTDATSSDRSPGFARDAIPFVQLTATLSATHMLTRTDDHGTGTGTGGGLSLALFERKLDVFAEGIALGERGFAAGIGTTFF